MILRMSRVSTMDATGARVLGDAIRHLERRGIVVLLSGVSVEHEDLLSALGAAADLRRQGRLFAETPAAIEHAREIVHRRDETPPRVGAAALSGA